MTIKGNKKSKNEKIAKVYLEAIKLFNGDTERAEKWLRTPCFALGNKIPIEVMKTEKGLQSVYDVIKAIEHGVFL